MVNLSMQSSIQYVGGTPERTGMCQPSDASGAHPLDGQSDGRLAGKRVLIVEDEALVALDLQFALEDEGATVLGPALSLPDAIDLITRETDIDGAILDVDLAGLQVFPAADLLRARDVPFVFHTGHGSRASLSELFPGSLTCSKPTLPSTLISALLRA